jgi:hypothetical protein
MRLRSATVLMLTLALLLLMGGIVGPRLLETDAARSAAADPVAAGSLAPRGGPLGAEGGDRDVVFGDHFSDRTMRVDYHHTGGLDAEIFALDRIVADGAWAGSRTRLVDDTNLGAYLFEVVEPSTGRVLYSRGYGSIFGEWETTSEAGRMHRTFHESVRFPWPLAPVEVRISKRDAGNVFREMWRTAVDPADPAVIPVERPAAGRVWSILDHGLPAEKVDLLILGDGYTRAELPRFRADARRLVDALFEHEPFRGRKSDFNVRALDLATAESGVNRPQAGRFRRTSLGAEYNIFGSERYILTLDNRSLRDIAGSAPYEFLVILVNDDQYGGGGILRDQATVAAHTDFAEYVFVHEFGHHFAGLGDEYYSSDVAYATGDGHHVEPWEPNITALHDPANLKWRELVDPTTPLPTPWAKAEFDAHAERIRAERRALIERGAPEHEFDALFRKQQAWETEFLGSMEHSGKVGAFEGASYQSTGLYRPEADCIMFTRNEVGFCAVCRGAIGQVIDLYARP